jgi:hypothetical protein
MAFGGVIQKMEIERIRMMGWVGVNSDSYFWKETGLRAKCAHKDLGVRFGLAQYDSGPI